MPSEIDVDEELVEEELEVESEAEGDIEEELQGDLALTDDDEAADFLEKSEDLLDDTDTPVADIAQALVQGRQRFGHHVVAAGADREALAAALRTAPATIAAATTKTRASWPRMPRDCCAP